MLSYLFIAKYPFGMLDVVIDKIYYTIGGTSDAVGFINGIVSACTTS